jgi:hypothetical protein
MEKSDFLRSDFTCGVLKDHSAKSLNNSLQSFDSDLIVLKDHLLHGKSNFSFWDVLFDKVIFNKEIFISNNLILLSTL